MRSLGKSLRNSVPAIGLGLMTAIGGLAAVSLAAAPAHAEQKKPAKVSKAFGKAMGESVKASQAGDWQTTLAKADEALQHAADANQTLDVQKMRTAAFANLGDKPNLVTAVEAQIATGALPADEQKKLRELLASLYSEMGNDAKALELTRTYVADYGGTPTQYAYIAQASLRAKDYPDTIAMAKKAIAASAAEGKQPEERWYKMVITAYHESGDVAGYQTAVAETLKAFPSDDYRRALVMAVDRAPKYDQKAVLLDVYRALQGVGVSLSDKEKLSMGSLAMRAAMPNEAEKLLKPLFDAGTFGGAGDPNAAETKDLYERAKTDAKSDRNGGLVSSEKTAAKAATGVVYVATGEAYMGMDDPAKAAELIQKGIEKGGLSADDLALAQLRLGVAQYKAGRVEEAKKTWAGINAENGAAELARAWSLFAS